MPGEIKYGRHPNASPAVDAVHVSAATAGSAPRVRRLPRRGLRMLIYAVPVGLFVLGWHLLTSGHLWPALLSWAAILGFLKLVRM